MPTTMRPCPVSTDRFTYLADRNEFVAEASDLYIGPGRDFMGRVYPDACDVGMTLVSAKTGREIVFAVEHVERDGDGDLLWWDLEPADWRGCRTQTAANVRVRIFND